MRALLNDMVLAGLVYLVVMAIVGVVTSSFVSLPTVLAAASMIGGDGERPWFVSIFVVLLLIGWLLDAFVVSLPTAWTSVYWTLFYRTITGTVPATAYRDGEQ
jgi:hypothetical protein